MSGVFTKIKKVFKKITKSAVGKFVLAAAVSYFTAGLGSSVLGAMGMTSLSPTLTTVLSHAISGSVTGGITSALTGGNIGKGMLIGGAGGAVMGGVQSSLGNYTTITPKTAPSAGGTASTAATNNVSANSSLPPMAKPTNVGYAPGATPPSMPTPTNIGYAPGMAPSALPTPANVGLAPGVTRTGLAANTGAGGGFVNVGAGGTPSHFVGYGVDSNTIAAGQTAMTPAGMVQGTGRTGLMGWVDRNPEFAGKMVGEGASGALKVALAGSGGGRDESVMEARIAAEKQAQAGVVASHDVTGGLLKPGMQAPRTGLTPTQRWNTPDTAYARGKWAYQDGKVVFIPAATA